MFCMCTLNLNKFLWHALLKRNKKLNIFSYYLMLILPKYNTKYPERMYICLIQHRQGRPEYRSTNRQGAHYRHNV